MTGDILLHKHYFYVADKPLYNAFLPPVGLHHDSVPASLLEGRAAVVPEHQQPEHDLRQPSGEEDLGSWHVLRPLQALLHPRHDDWQRHAEGLPRWQRPLQSQVNTLAGACVALIKPQSLKTRRKTLNI